MSQTRTDRSTGLLPILFALLALVMAIAPAAANELPDKVTFSEHVAPILFNSCVSCHRPGDVAPMSLLSYEEARPWAKSIRRAVSARDMPPWDADPKHGDFANDISLSADQIALIERWVEQGAEQGNADLMPALPALPAPGSWKMGREPDVVVELAAVDVAADGPDIFVTQLGIVDLPEGKWLQAVELLPGNTEILHHVVTYLGPFGMSEEEVDDEYSNAGINKVVYLNERARQAPGMAEAPEIGGVWVAGSPPNEYRKGTGHPLNGEQRLSFNMHYHPSGNAGTDASKVGLYFGEGELQKEITTAFAADPGLIIPAGAADHHEKAVYHFSEDSQIVSLLPHMHNRGKSMKYTIERPGEEPEIILNVPEYDYDWQNIYVPREPIRAPAGSVVTAEAVWDNSAENEANPDASIDVEWGDGTNNEMLVAFVDFIVVDGVKPKAVRSTQKVHELLDRHPAEAAYSVAVEGMGFGGEWGVVLPNEQDDEGWFYMGFGSLMFSTSIPEITRVGDEMLFNGAMITSGGGTRTPLGFLAKLSADGSELSGELFFGRDVIGADIEELRGKGRAFRGKSRAAAAAAEGTGAGR